MNTLSNLTTGDRVTLDMSPAPKEPAELVAVIIAGCTVNAKDSEIWFGSSEDRARGASKYDRYVFRRTNYSACYLTVPNTPDYAREVELTTQS